jgi:hypothetical protein
MLSAVITILLVQATVRDDPPPSKKPPTPEQLAAITARGRLLAEYDRAAWYASDEVQKHELKDGVVERYIARKTDKGWVVAFGRVKDDKRLFLIAYEAIQGKDPKQFQFKAYDPPKEDAAFYRPAARAIDLSLKDFTKTFKGQKRPYNVAILPAEKSQWWVYFVPAPTQEGIWPLGADVRYLMSPDGSRIIQKRQLHNAVIENPPPKPGPDNQLVAGMHNHVLDDVPEDTDVFHVLQRQPNVPELIVTKEFVFAIEADGSIKYAGTAKEVLKKK